MKFVVPVLHQEVLDGVVVCLTLCVTITPIKQNAPFIESNELITAS